MSHDPRADPHSTAVEQLEAFRLSTYAARTFVALVSLGSGTAKEVSQVAEVPRTRVYDAVEELHSRGLVDIYQSSPQRFTPISADSTRWKLEGDTQHRLSVLTTALEQLEPSDRDGDKGGIWTVDRQQAIVDRLLEFFTGANEEIVYIAADQQLSAALIEGLATAADRGVSVSLGGLSEEAVARVRAEIPTADRIETGVPVPSDMRRLLLVDGSKTLVSVQVGNPDPKSETAIWGAGETNSLVVILTSIFGLEAVTADQKPTS